MHDIHHGHRSTDATHDEAGRSLFVELLAVTPLSIFVSALTGATAARN